jgi:anhydro-N-acetylmuramic acid kinase
MAAELYAGVMSGTSLDGIDAVVADFARGGCRLRGFVSLPFPVSLRSELLALQARCDDEIARAARAGNALADLYAEAIVGAVSKAGAASGEIVAAGVHGQTLRHRPAEGWTLQLNNPARVAERCGVTVVADFRSRDVAAGGQGAPLVPAFHAAVFGSPVHRAVVNIGGIANVTDLPPGGFVRGFDTGPGNVLLDLWHVRHRGGAFDAGGAWARSGRVDEDLLEAMLAEPFLAIVPPRSTGRDLFNATWLDRLLNGRQILPVDVQATLLVFTARSIAEAIGCHCATARTVLVCGGGARNAALIERLGVELAAPEHAGQRARQLVPRKPEPRLQPLGPRGLGRNRDLRRVRVGRRVRRGLLLEEVKQRRIR